MGLGRIFKIGIFVAVLIILLIIFVPLITNKPGEGLEVIAEGLDTPWGMDFLPDGSMIFTERGGDINLLKDRSVTRIAFIPVSEKSEAGLLGIAADPDFEENHFIYIYYTYDEANRVSRFKLVEDSLEDETILLDNIPNALYHDGGRIKFGLDGKLYVTTGDATKPSSAQDTDSLAGKILRMNKDGTVPEGNPFDNLVYSYGHRNPQGLSWDGDAMYASEHGPTRNDELNIIEKGNNYGWPEAECIEIMGVYTQPIRCFSEFTLAPSGIDFHEGSVYMAGLRGNQVRRIDIVDGEIIAEEEMFTDLGRVRNVVVHDGYLYISTSNKDGRGIPSPKDDMILRYEL